MKLKVDLTTIQMVLFVVGSIMVLTSSDGYWHNANYITYLGLIIGAIGIFLHLIIGFINWLSRWK
jgi:hypothetical protein